MQTRLLSPGPDALVLAARLLNDGALVAFPTETVYGLGANALNPDAVRSIFEAKGRPADNPLIVHIYDRAQLEPLCTVPERAPLLMDAFWPGPLTMLFPRKSTIPDIVTAGLPTVAIRMPSHPVAAAMLEEVLGEEVELAGSILRPLKPDEKALSPGMRYRHYAPKGTVTLVEGDDERVVETMRSLCLKDLSGGKKSCVLCFSEHVDQLSGCFPHDMGSRRDEKEVAHRLFDILRALDQEGMETVYSEVLPPEEVGLAVMNRLGRAASFKTIRV